MTRNWAGERVAIVVNDLGMVSVDAQRMADTASGLLELSGGCVCCNIQDELLFGLEDLLQSESAPFNRIVLEASGISDPARIAQILESEPLNEWVELNRQITVVHTIRHVASRGAIVQIDNQVKGADIILMNHYDEATEECRRTARYAVREVNSLAPIIAANYCRVEIEELVLAAPRVQNRDTAHTGPAVGWKSCRIFFPDPVDQVALEEAMRELPETLVRLKGFLRAETGRILHVERVGRDLYIEYWEGTVDPQVVGALVAIGASSLQELTSVFCFMPNVRMEYDTSLHLH
tara:strand:+ start:10742 stop:11617 length:876 start_codon:yes stop_codon:yes gene_type:complete